MGELTPPIPDRAGTLRPISLRKANDTEVKRYAQDASAMRMTQGFAIAGNVMRNRHECASGPVTCVGA